MLKAVILDFDGIIMDTESARAEACEKIHNEYRVAFSLERFIGSVGKSTTAMDDPWVAFPESVSRNELEHKYKQGKEALFALKPAMPGVVALIDDARARGFKLAVASNSLRVRVQPLLEQLNLLPLFDDICCRGEGFEPKPEPSIYTELLRRLDIRSDEAIAFEDSASGVLSAKRAGVNAIAVPNELTQHHDFTSADVLINSLSEVSLSHLVERFTYA